MISRPLLIPSAMFAMLAFACSAPHEDDVVDSTDQTVLEDFSANNPKPNAVGTIGVHAPPPEPCSGLFACLHGTPACVNDEWTCVGGGGGEEQ